MTAPLPVTEPVAPLPLLAPTRPSALTWNLVALAVATLAAVGSLWLSLGMGLQACPLCYYQRVFVFGAAGVLLLAQLTELRDSDLVAVLAMPLAVGGLSVAGYHVSRELVGKMECPLGILGLGTGPKQAFAVQLALVIVLAIGARRRPVAVVGILLGALLGFACISSTAPLPKPSPADYEKPPTICRPLPAPPPVVQ